MLVTCDLPWPTLTRLRVALPACSDPCHPANKVWNDLLWPSLVHPDLHASVRAGEGCCPWQPDLPTPTMTCYDLHASVPAGEGCCPWQPDLPTPTMMTCHDLHASVRAGEGCCPWQPDLPTPTMTCHDLHASVRAGGGCSPWLCWPGHPPHSWSTSPTQRWFGERINPVGSEENESIRRLHNLL